MVDWEAEIKKAFVSAVLFAVVLALMQGLDVEDRIQSFFSSLKEQQGKMQEGSESDFDAEEFVEDNPE